MEITGTQLRNKQGHYLKASIREPVKITLHGRVEHVILSIEDYEQLIKESKLSKQKE